jgi:hypothetical protein
MFLLALQCTEKDLRKRLIMKDVIGLFKMNLFIVSRLQLMQHHNHIVLIFSLTFQLSALTTIYMEKARIIHL